MITFSHEAVNVSGRRVPYVLLGFILGAVFMAIPWARGFALALPLIDALVDKTSVVVAGLPPWLQQVIASTVGGFVVTFVLWTVRLFLRWVRAVCRWWRARRVAA
ncbi:MAG: hypothetical protein OXU35_00320 [Acidobacteriota bacterium]|nr:hypothetical protein [Acidobacteriota bacterium]